MAPRYEPMQPFAPQVSRDYGEAEVMTRNNPVVYGAGSDTARMRERIGESRADRGERSAARGAADRNDMLRVLAGKTAQDYDNLQRGNIASGELQQRQYEQEDERQLRVNQLEFQRSVAQAEMEHQRNQLQSRAAVEQMLLQNKVTFEDQQQDAQLSRRMSEVANSNMFNDAEKEEMLKDMASRGQFTKMRVQKAQTELLEQRAKEQESQVAQQTMIQEKWNAFSNKKQFENIEYTIAPDVKAQLERELPQPTPQEVAYYGSAQEARRHQVAAAARQQGALYSMREQVGYDTNGKPVYQRQDVQKPEAAYDPMKIVEQTLDIESKIADLELKKAEALDDASRQNIDASIGRLQGMVARNEQRLQGGQRGERSDGVVNLGAVKDPVVRDQITNVQAAVSQVAANPYVPPEAKGTYAALAKELSELLAKPNKTEENRKRIAELSAVQQPGEGIQEVRPGERRGPPGAGNVVVGPNDPARLAARGAPQGNRMPAAPVNPFARAQYPR